MPTGLRLLSRMALRQMGNLGIYKFQILLIITRNLQFTSSIDGARGKPCFKAPVIRAQETGGQERLSDALGIAVPEPGAHICGGVSKALLPARHTKVPLVLGQSLAWPVFETLPFLKSTKHN